MTEGYQVEPAELQRAAREITGCVPTPREVPLEEIAGNAASYGHNGVYAALSRFCTTWQIAAALLSNSAQKAGGALTAVAADYARQNQAAEDSFSGIGAAIGEAVSGFGAGGIAEGIGGGIAKGVSAVAEGVSGAAGAITDRLSGPADDGVS